MKRWPTKPLAALGPLTDGDWILKENYVAGGVRLIQVGDVGEGEFIGKSSRFISLKRAKELQCSFLKTGDILVSRMPDPLGRACIFPGLDLHPPFARCGVGKPVVSELSARCIDFRRAGAVSDGDWESHTKVSGTGFVLCKLCATSLCIPVFIREIWCA
jgi:hypothetical protein